MSNPPYLTTSSRPANPWHIENQRNAQTAPANASKGMMTGGESDSEYGRSEDIEGSRLMEGFDKSPYSALQQQRSLRKSPHTPGSESQGEDQIADEHQQDEDESYNPFEGSDPNLGENDRSNKGRKEATGGDPSTPNLYSSRNTSRSDGSQLFYHQGSSSHMPLPTCTQHEMQEGLLVPTSRQQSGYQKDSHSSTSTPSRIDRRIAPPPPNSSKFEAASSPSHRARRSSSFADEMAETLRHIEQKASRRIKGPVNAKQVGKFRSKLDSQFIASNNDHQYYHPSQHPQSFTGAVNTSTKSPPTFAYWMKSPKVASLPSHRLRTQWVTSTSGSFAWRTFIWIPNC